MKGQSKGGSKVKLRKITDPHEVRQIYKEHIAVDFPASERPPLPHFVRAIEQSASELYLCEKDGQDVAYAVFREESGYILLNYFAVYKDRRGKGTGTELLQEIRNSYADKKGIILEAEHVDYAKSQADQEIRRKRIAFYERCGYTCLLDFDLLLFGEHYHVMVQPICEDKTGDREYIYEILCRMYSGIPAKHAADVIRWVR